MSQSRRASLGEACTSVAIGFALSLCMHSFLIPAYGLKTSVQTGVQITLWFTALSLVCSYTLRRIFNWIGTRKRKPARARAVHTASKGGLDFYALAPEVEAPRDQ